LGAEQGTHKDSIKEFKEGKSMLRNKYRSLIYTATILTALVGRPMFSSLPIVRANPGPDSAAANATFRTKCAMCHGQDGAGSAVGKSMNVPDLRSPVVQKTPDAELAQVISNGKGGMPAFKSSLSEDQIHDLVTHIRSLHQKK
jgi:mono/diheme cytochrome c family protein